ncbi:MAG: creatininase family protein [Thermoproteota archaeon]|nr:creatininase family protein [Thermoproteota archaeon]
MIGQKEQKLVNGRKPAYRVMSLPVFGMNEHDFRIGLKRIRRAIIPVGSLEQHGAHLPLSTDSIIAEYFARMVAEKIGAFVMPVFSYGVSFEHKPMFNVSLRNSTLSTMICDACTSLAEMRIRHIIVVNGHHGNTGALQYISQELHNKIARNVNVHAIHYWQMMRRDFDHAGEVETSLVLAIAPELVHMNRAMPNSKKLSKSRAAYSSITNVPGSFPKITGNGVWGNPRKATAAKGENLIKEITSNLARTIIELE